MADENSAPAAATGETTPFHSIDAAVSHLDQEQERQQKAEAPTPAEADKEPASEIVEDEAPAQEAAATDDEPAEEAEAPADDAEPEGETDDEDEVVHGNAKARLRDGTVVAVADLKKAFGELQELKRQGGDITTQRAEVDKAKAEIQQLKQHLDKVLPIALQVANETVPPAPEEALWDTDPIEAMQQQRRHDAGRQRLAELQSGQKADTETKQKEQAAALEAYVKEQQQLLRDKLPEVRKPETAKAFYEDVVKYGTTAYGFSQDEINQAYDHRLMLLMKDAVAYKKLQSAKPKAVEKAKDAIPVQKPGRRIAPSEKATTDRDAAFKKLAPNGTFTDHRVCGALPR
jgi:hypothetical protein